MTRATDTVADLGGVWPGACGRADAGSTGRGKAGIVQVGEVLEFMGGVATRRALVRATSRSAVDRAVVSGDVVVLARGRYALASHASAALRHGWPVRQAPSQPHVTVPRNRLLTTAQRVGVRLHRTTLGPDDVDGLVTSRERTLLDCLRAGPFDDALCVADSALRDGFPRARLLALARDARGPGSLLMREVAALADARAANAFESALRAIALRVPGLGVVPQVAIREPHFLGRPDLVDEKLRVVLEADSFEWHGSRAALARDARRYNRLSVRGWLVLRFAWEDVVLHPEDVRVILTAAVHERTEGGCRCRLPA